MIVTDDSKQPWKKFGFYFIHYLCRCCVCILYMLCVVQFIDMFYIQLQITCRDWINGMNMCVCMYVCNTPLLYSSYIKFSYAVPLTNICNLSCVHFACSLLFSIQHSFIPHLLDPD